MEERREVNKIKEIMAANGFTQKDFQEILCISAVTLRKKINNTDNFTIKDIKDLAEGTGVDKEELWKAVK
ncbi:Helix-turn-helix [Jeotgalicoccus aerolatus]|uniref:Helix-turn-helix n=1 Tax=Jeotgalicoccus aerolatus TaxID=709510 RepID=A0A1G9CXY4_9STAP|nr:helix-turn-helix transcriptional regulator [Jeotgalicoccus aerolatus]SDK56499.1 Helix-turn-helix [Jeotgalicoccus aerolatus]